MRRFRACQLGLGDARHGERRERGQTAHHPAHLTMTEAQNDPALARIDPARQRCCGASGELAELR
jgi:hypothetical protein